jgi:lysophospholipase L1-like esterase
MASTLHFFEDARFISANGQADSGTIYFYYTGTTNLAPIYANAALTNPLTNPVVIATGQILPSIYLDSSITYRRRIVFNSDASVLDRDPIVSGSVRFSDLSSTTGAALIKASDGNTVEAKLATLTSNLTSATAATAAAGILNSNPAVLPYQVTGLAGGIGTGTGGTAGTYVGGVSGGPAGFAWAYTIAAGALASYTITNPGISTSSTAPTLSLPFGGLSGVTVPTATTGIVPVGKVFFATTSDSKGLALWQNVAGTLTAVTNPDTTQIVFYNKGAEDAIVTAAAASATAAANSAAAAAGIGLTSFNNVTTHNPNLAVTIQTGVYVNKTNGSINTLAGLDTYSGPCTPGTVLQTNRTTPFNSAGLAFFNSSGTYLSGQDLAAFTNVTVPANSASFKITITNPGYYDQAGAGANPRYTFMVWDTAQPIPTDYQAPGYVDPYQSKVNSTVINKNFLPVTWDYFDPDQAIANFAVNTNGGALSSIANINTTGYIPCQYNVPVYVSHPYLVGNGAYAIAWYDHNQNFIAGYGNSSVTANISGFSFTVTAQGQTQGRIGPGLVVYHANYPGGSTVITAGPADGGLGTYTTLASGTTGTGLTLDCRGYLANTALMPPKGAGLVRLSYDPSNHRVLRISNTQFASTSDMHNYVGYADIKKQYPLRNKVGAILGTSIMKCIKTGADDRMTYQLEKYTRSYIAMSRAVPGWSTIQLLGSTTAAGYPAIRGTQGALSSSDFANIDWCLSDGGINDFGSLTSIGTLGDTGTTTVYGVLYNTYIANIQTWNPNTRIILTTPLPTFASAGYTGDFANGNPTNGSGYKLSDVADAVKAFAQRYKFPVIDLFYDGIGINAINKNNFLDNTDLLHPIAAGYDRIIPYIADRLNRIGAAQ